ncbi:MAG: hypothetical protein RL346_1391, partial [Verrucomicrobiota bacterium]
MVRIGRNQPKTYESLREDQAFFAKIFLADPTEISKLIKYPSKR